MEANAPRHLHVEVNLRAIPISPDGLGRDTAAMAPAGRLVVGVHGTNRHAVGILNDFDEQFAVVIVASPNAFDTDVVARSSARLNLPVSIDHFQRLTSLQVSLPTEIV